MRKKLLNILITLLLVFPIVTNANSYLLSQEQPVTASSTELATLSAENTVDGDDATRWASVEGSDTEWIYIDLGKTALIDSVVLNWETAYGKSYEIQIADNPDSWTTIYSTTNGDGGIDELSVDGEGRYVRMYGTERGTQWGFSLWEIKVYGDFQNAGQYNLNTLVTGNGIIAGAGPVYSANTWAEFEALPDSGWKFERWEGDLSGNNNPAAIRMNAEKSITAVFEELEVPAKTPVEINGQLRVEGVKLVNQYGNPIQLRGMSTHGIQWYWNNYTDESLDVLAYDWGADILRISLYVQEGGWVTDPAGFTQKVNILIEKAAERGMYALVDWHQLQPPDPNYNLENAKVFFTEIANIHKDKNNIIYDICNEPSDVTWDTIKNYADSIIPVIRNIDSDAVILIGTHGWASLGVSDGRTHQDILNNPLDFPNIMYTFHFYAASHQDSYLEELNAASDVLPIFVTEWGTQVYDGDQENDFEFSQQYIDLMHEKKISWINWNYSCDHRSGAVWASPATGFNNGPWTDDNLKPAGLWIKDKILNPADDFPTGTTSIRGGMGNLKLPADYNLQQNFPNPFNPSTKIQYSLPKTCDVSLKVYDLLGSEVMTIFSNQQAKGSYEAEINSSQLSSGVYFYRLQTAEFADSKKMIVLK